MPLGEFERRVLQTLGPNRSPDSFVAGATVLHQRPDSPRWSLDVDLFHDSTAALERAVAGDLELLNAAGYTFEKQVSTGTLVRGVVELAGQQSKIDWAVDSPFRFFPPEPDLELGWKLNFWDAATNKLLALFSRHEFRDFYDVLHLHQHHLCLGALIWAAAAKDPGLTPELILDWFKRNSRYAPEEIRQIRVREIPDLRELKETFFKACEEAEQLTQNLPIREMGCLYLGESLQPVCPNPAGPEFASLRRHYATMKGTHPQ